MNAALLLAAILGFAALLGMLRLLLQQAKQPTARWRIITLLLAQPLCAALLYLTLLPPHLANMHDDEALMVLSSDSTAAQLSEAKAHNAVIVALPETPQTLQQQTERQPDLATALRQHPHTARLHVFGSGLEARDRDIAVKLPIEFSATEPEHGFLRLQIPQQLAPGQSFAITGQVHANTGDKIELLDPAGQRVTITAADTDGHFRIEGNARTEGLAQFVLHLRDADDKTVERIAIPLWVAKPEPLRALLLAGAPNAELKYLRRWASDAGIELRTRMELGGSIALGDAPALDTAALRKFDLLLLDNRTLDGLSTGERATLRQAVDDGLGLLLRMDDALSADTRAQLRGWGFTVEGDGDNATVRLPANPNERGTNTPTTLTTRRLRVNATDAVPLLRDAEEKPLAWWRASGRGRVGLWPLTDTYTWVLHGASGQHGALWSEVFATLSRTGSQQLAYTADARVNQRISICPADDAAEVIAPNANTTHLLPDPHSGTPACAAFWPQQSGWHWLREGERLQPFFVRATDDAPGLQRTIRSDATRALVNAAPSPATAAASSTLQPAPRGASWPWFLAWLICTAALWWLERRAVKAPLPSGEGLG
jgi:hypothetical protein